MAPQPTSLDDTNDILFDLYDLAKERFYIIRKEDDTFLQTLNQYGVWIYGVSGCGKSNLILRNLVKQRASFCQINLASCIGAPVESFFYEILYELSSQVENGSTVVQPHSFSECSKALLTLLEKQFRNKHQYIFIEEIPICDGTSQKEFAERIYSLLISKVLIPGLNNVKFILSSIENPTSHIQIIHHKIHQQLKFVELTNWAELDTEKLIDLITKALHLKLDASFRSQLMTVSNGSPRFIKKFFRNLLAFNEQGGSALIAALKETERELNLL